MFLNDGTGRQFSPMMFGDKNGAMGFALGDINKDWFLDIALALARSGAPNVLYLSGK